MAYKVKFRHKTPKGKIVGELGPFLSKKKAVTQAQVMADSGTLDPSLIVTVEKVGGTAKRRNNSIKPGDVVHTSWTTAPGSKVSILVQRLETFGPDIKASGIFSNGHAKSAAQVLQQTTGQKAWTWGSRVTKVVKPTRRKNPSSRTYKGHKIKGKTGKYTVEPYGFPFTTLKEAKGWLDKHVRDAYPKPNPTVPDVWGIQAKYGSKVVPPGKYKTLPLPPRVGTDLYYEAPTAQGGVANLTVKKKGAGSYYLTIGGGRFQGLRNTKEAREDIQHFLESGRLPARRNPKQATKRRKNWGAGSFAEKPVTLLFSTKEKANAFKKSLDKNEVSGKFSVRKTKGWNTYSLVFTPHSYSDVVAIRKYYRPEKSHYKDIERDLRTNPRRGAL